MTGVDRSWTELDRLGQAYIQKISKNPRSTRYRDVITMTFLDIRFWIFENKKISRPFPGYPRFSLDAKFSLDICWTEQKTTVWWWRHAPIRKKEQSRKQNVAFSQNTTLHVWRIEPRLAREWISNHPKIQHPKFW